MEATGVRSPSGYDNQEHHMILKAPATIIFKTFTAKQQRDPEILSEVALKNQITVPRSYITVIDREVLA